MKYDCIFYRFFYCNLCFSSNYVQPPLDFSVITWREGCSKDSSCKHFLGSLPLGINSDKYKFHIS